MTLKRVSPLLLVVMAVFMAACFGKSPEATADLSGVVVDTEGADVTGLVVAFGGKTGTTNADGKFTIRGVEYGSGRLTVSKDGRIRQLQDVVFNEDTGSITVEVDLGNLVVNGGFEFDDPEQPKRAALWSFFSINEVEISPEAARTGDLGVKMVAESGNNVRAQQRVPVEAGQTYEVSVWMKAIDADSGHGQIKFEWWPSSGTTVYEESSPEFALKDHGDWSLLTYSSEAPEGAVDLGILIRLYGPGEAYFDDAEVRVVD